MAQGSVPQFASLYVGDLHPDVTEAMLYEIFNSVGPVGSIRVCRDSVTRRSLGYGYVNFHAVGDAERALDTLNYSSIKGRACRIMWSQRDPTLRKSGVGNIYVNNLDRSIDNKALYDTFSLFGNILSCKVASDPQGKSLGHGFVHYETEEAAKQAIERVNEMMIGDKTVHVSSFLKRSDREPKVITNYTNLYIKGFPQDWTDKEINEAFGAQGEITSTVLMESKGRKFAFVNFKESASALKCVEEMHGKDYRTEDEKKAAEEKEEKDEDPAGILYVTRAVTKAERQREFKAKQAAAQDAGPKTAQGVNLYVKNLDDGTDDESLKSLFESFGAITSAKAMTDEKGKCKGFGFVSFASPDDATKAVTEMHLKVVQGKPLYVGLAEKREARAERLSSRYSVGVGKGGKGSKGGGKGGKGKWEGPSMGGQQMGGMGGMMGGMGGGQMGGMMGGQMGGMMGGMMGGQMGGMMGKGGPMMGGPQMGGKGGPMMGGPQMGGKGGPMMGMGGPMAGPRPMMGGPQQQMMMGQQQMMQMMQGKGQPQMMGMMGKGGMPGGPMPGMMRPMAPPQMQGGPRPMGGQPMPAQQTPQPMPNQPLNASVLAAAPPNVQKQMIGEKLYPAIAKYNPEMAGKVTGMMLEMDNSELLMLLESEQQMKLKVDEALLVLGGKQ